VISGNAKRVSTAYRGVLRLEKFTEPCGGLCTKFNGPWKAPALSKVKPHDLGSTYSASRSDAARTSHSFQLRFIRTSSPDVASMSSTDFALAQQRIAARRQARESERQSALAAQLETSQTAQQLSKLPYPLGYLGNAGVSTWNSIRGREGTRPAFRVGQVDAELLDEELLELLKAQVGEALKYFGGHIQDEWSAEILLALRAILFKLTVWDHDATYGAALQNLKFTDARKKSSVLVAPSKWQKALYGLFTVGGQYTWRRWEDWLVDNDNGYDEPSPVVRRLSNLSSTLSTVHSTAALASFLVFLVNGRYRTLLDRILRLRLAPPTSQVSREVSFEYLNRQLVWHAFTEFLLFVLPLVGISRWRRWISRAWRKTKSIVTTGVEDSEETKAGEFAFLPERTCAICYQDQNSTGASENDILAASAGAGGVIGSAQTDITNPYETIPCGCIYCFVCLAGRLEAEEGEGWVCLRCGELVKECKPWSGDVIEEVSKSGSTSKTVGFSTEGIDEDNNTVMEEIDPRAEEDDDTVRAADDVPTADDDDDDEDDQSEGYEEDEDEDAEYGD
jgi:peroxin-2